MPGAPARQVGLGRAVFAAAHLARDKQKAAGAHGGRIAVALHYSAWRPAREDNITGGMEGSFREEWLVIQAL